MNAQIGALEANLARTAVDVEIPERHLPLLEITERWHGVHAATAALLREVHHTYVGWPQALTDLHRLALGDFHYHDGHPRGDEAIAIVCELYRKIATEATPDDVRTDAVRRWLMYLDHVAGESTATRARNLPVVADAVSDLAGVLAASPELMPIATTGLRKLCRTLTAAGGDTSRATEVSLDALRRALEALFTRWIGEDDPDAWLAESGCATPPSDLATHAELRAALRAVRAVRPPLAPHAGTLLALPDQAQIIRGYLLAADRMTEGRDRRDGLIARIRWLLRVLGQPGLASAHETALRDAARAVAELMTLPTVDRPRVVREVFQMLRANAFPYHHTVLNLVTRIGTEALSAGDPDLAEQLIDEVLALDFEYPGFSGFTAEWALRANPAHVECIRTWLRLVEADPITARPLLAALVAHLRLGGVSIPDSELFQRDVSAFLGEAIAPIYVQAVHLLRLLPAYFGEIGSEGTLREVSTRIDEALHRRDPLCHFLRKQCHVECNPHLIDFVEEIARYWATGDRTPLERFLPSSVYASLASLGPAEGIHAVMARLVDEAGSLDTVLSGDPDELRDRLRQSDAGTATDRERAELLVRVWHEVRRKYALDHSDVTRRLRDYRRIDTGLIGVLEDALATEDLAGAFDAALTILERLQAIILRPGPTEAAENIYFKRHIAVGIPSIYGSYHEERLDAVGLTFRLQSLAGAIAHRMMDAATLPTEPRERLRAVAVWLHQLHRGLRTEGFRAQGLAYTLAMLDEALARDATTDAQLLTVFQLLGRNLEVTIRTRILDVYEMPVRTVVTSMIERGLLDSADGASNASVLRHSEGFLRDLISGSFVLQRLDLLIGQNVRELSDRVQAGRDTAAPAPAAPSAATSVLPIADAPRELGIVTLGGKAFMLRQLHRMGLRVPPGFVLTTDVFRARRTIATTPRLREGFEHAIRSELARVEASTGTRFGDPRRPLLLSVRAGAPISMPGMLATFLNVGINEAIAEGLTRGHGEWMAWDAYRRFLQSWGMAHGMTRDPFDELMAAAKRAHGAARKSHLSPEAMRELSGRYRDTVAGAGVAIESDPFRQLMRCIDLAHDSWDSPAAAIYRRELHISDEWGTAAIVQAMVFGNRSPRTGTGVLLTDNPERSSDIVSLTGDFTVQSQGDDVVSGVIETYPLTELQRIRQARATTVSLERNFPEIHDALVEIARFVVQDHGMNHQEIEFTFDGDRADDLYLLQMRDAVVTTADEVPAFLPSPELEAAKVAVGIGVSGGAMSGRAASTLAEIERLRELAPGEPVILLRPDTVPEDIALVLAADGVLTALGGATSHAAVAAKRLGKTCVVGCRDLDVDDRAGRAKLGDHVIGPGDTISISGLDGTVYLDAHPVTMIGVESGKR